MTAGMVVVGGEVVKDVIVVGAAVSGESMAMSVAGAAGGAVAGTIAVDGVADHVMPPSAPADPVSPTASEKQAPPSESEATEPNQTKPRHGNFIDDRPASRYTKVDIDGKLRKHGVTRHADPRKRYSKKEIGDGDVWLEERGPRKEMLKKERELVETDPGPDNHEPWAGKRKR